MVLDRCVWGCVLCFGACVWGLCLLAIGPLGCVWSNTMYTSYWVLEVKPYWRFTSIWPCNIVLSLDSATIPWGSRGFPRGWSHTDRAGGRQWAIITHRSSRRVT